MNRGVSRALDERRFEGINTYIESVAFSWD